MHYSVLKWPENDLGKLIPLHISFWHDDEAILWLLKITVFRSKIKKPSYGTYKLTFFVLKWQGNNTIINNIIHSKMTKTDSAKPKNLCISFQNNEKTCCWILKIAVFHSKMRKQPNQLKMLYFISKWQKTALLRLKITVQSNLSITAT